jgi:hypothetical protein
VRSDCSIYITCISTFPMTSAGCLFIDYRWNLPSKTLRDPYVMRGTRLLSLGTTHLQTMRFTIRSEFRPNMVVVSRLDINDLANSLSITLLAYHIKCLWKSHETQSPNRSSSPKRTLMYVTRVHPVLCVCGTLPYIGQLSLLHIT